MMRKPISLSYQTRKAGGSPKPKLHGSPGDKTMANRVVPPATPGSGAARGSPLHGKVAVNAQAKEPTKSPISVNVDASSSSRTAIVSGLALHDLRPSAAAMKSESVPAEE